MRYKIGDLVLVKLQKIEVGGAQSIERMVFEIDGVTEKIVDGAKTIRYESGKIVFNENEVEGKVLLEKPRAPRTRKSKKSGSMDQQIDLQNIGDVKDVHEPMP